MKQKTKRYKVWVEFEREIKAKSLDEAETIFGDELELDDLILNGVELK